VQQRAIQTEYAFGRPLENNRDVEKFLVSRPACVLSKHRTASKWMQNYETANNEEATSVNDPEWNDACFRK
jgi:hypothetical protein